MAKTVYLGMIGDIMHPGLINIITEGSKYGDVKRTGGRVPVSRVRWWRIE